MWMIILILSVTSCNAVYEFSSRPTNVSLQLMQFTRKELNEPIFIGTFGTWSLLAGLSFGASDETHNQISSLLLTDTSTFNTEYKNLTDILFKSDVNGVRVSNKNYLLIDADAALFPEFKSILVNYYDTEVYTLDFQDPNTASLVNKRIKAYSPYVENIFEANDFNQASVIMCNVLFFEGNWSIPFNISSTSKALVKTYSGDIVDLYTMRLTSGKIAYIYMETMQATVAELPFGNDGKFSMLILIPDPNVSSIEVFRNFEKFSFRDMFAKLRSEIEKSGLESVKFILPRLVSVTNIQLNKPLKGMGIYDAFDDTFAKFSKISKEPIYIETIEQNNVLLITESGVVAYSTTPGVSRGSFYLDENYAEPTSVLFIVEKSTETVLFGAIY